jgi:nicotinate-nucleotide adenylyltransferase
VCRPLATYPPQGKGFFRGLHLLNAGLMTVNRGNRTTVDLEPLREILTPEAMDRIIYVQMPEMSLSASDIRRRIRQKLSIRYLTPPSVVEYIMQHRLYTDEYAYL